MSLHDVDKSGLDRGTPDPNAPDQIIQGAWKNHGTHSIQPTTGASTTVGYIQTKNAQILTFDGQTNRLQITPTQMKVSRAGFDVTTATDDELIFNSGQDIFKIIQKQSTTIPAFTIGSGGTNYSIRTIAHGLSTTPLILAFASGAWVKGDTGVKTTTFIQLPIYAPRIGFGYLFPATGGTYYSANLVYGVDATNIYFQAETDSTLTASTMSAIPITYFVLQETAN